MSTLLFVPAFLLVALLVYLGRYSGRLRVQVERVIAAPPEQVRAQVADLTKWQHWNPWLEHAPQTQARWDETRQALRWDADPASCATVHALPGPAVRQQLRFSLPFACRGRSDWQFDPVPAGTRVRWHFKGRVAFTLRAFAATVQGALALDMRFGLDRLAAVLEGGTPAYRLTYLGEQAQPEQHFAQRAHHGRLQDLPADVARGLTEVRQQLAAAGLPAQGCGTVHYLRTLLKRRELDARIGLPWADPAVALPLGLTRHTQPAHTAWVLRFAGPARDLELAWYQVMQALRVAGRQPHPTLPPYERYTADRDAQGCVAAELFLPVKA